MTSAQAAREPRRLTLPHVLGASGAVVALVCLVAGVIARQFADGASRAASSATRLISVGPNSLALTFDPSSAHYVAPDYTVFWICMAAMLVGLSAMAAGLGIFLVARRSS